MSKTRVEEAKERVLWAISERKRFGKHYSNNDLPVEFLDDLVLISDDESTPGRYVTQEEYDALKEKLTKANRQLAAANARGKKAEKAGNSDDSVAL